MNHGYIHIALSGLFAVSIAAPSAYAQTAPGIVEREVTTPVVPSLVWKTSRDLIVLFEDSSDRVSIAQQVMQAAGDPSSSLSPQQRFDGFTIAGHTMWVDSEFELAKQCFTSAIELDYNEDSTADSARMLAQCHLALGDFSAARDSYLLCYNISKSIKESSGYHDLYGMVAIPLMSTAQQSGDHGLTVAVASEMIENGDGVARYQKIKPNALKIGAMSALELGSNVVAEEYLTTLLEEYPEFGMDFLGTRVTLEMSLLKAQGFSMAEYDPEAVATAMDIVLDEQYFGLPHWADLVAKIGKLLDANSGSEEANMLRLWAVDQQDVLINALDPMDASTEFKKTALMRTQLTCLRDAARSFKAAGQVEQYTETLEQIVDGYSEIDPQYVATASQELNLVLLQQSP
jgi:tetratricopeptide (TPR) repeat protein